MASSDLSAPAAHNGLAAAVVAPFTLLVAGGAQRSNRANAVIVVATLAALVALVVFGLPSAASQGRDILKTLFDGHGNIDGPWQATALMFMA